MNSDQPIIVIKKRARSHGHHGGAWKVAYADFVTAMMAFFLVMWILGLNQDSRKAIASYFQDPTGMMKNQPSGSQVISLPRHEAPKKTTMVNGRDKLLKFKKDQQALNNAKLEIEKRIKETPRLSRFSHNIEIRLSREGLRIELLEDKEPLFFESGRADLRPATVELLHLIGPVLAKLPNSIIVEGHTDARPYSGGAAGYTNMDLSTDRANAARRALEPKLAASQLKEVRGYGASRLRKPEDPFHFSNRRISVLVPAMNYIEGVPTQQADEQGLLGLKPGAPNLGDEFLAAAQQTAQSKKGTP